MVTGKWSGVINTDNHLKESERIWSLNTNAREGRRVIVGKGFKAWLIISLKWPLSFTCCSASQYTIPELSFLRTFPTKLHHIMKVVVLYLLFFLLPSDLLCLRSKYNASTIFFFLSTLQPKNKSTSPVKDLTCSWWRHLQNISWDLQPNWLTKFISALKPPFLTDSFHRVLNRPTLRALLSGTFLQTLP